MRRRGRVQTDAGARPAGWTHAAASRFSLRSSGGGAGARGCGGGQRGQGQGESQKGILLDGQTMLIFAGFSIETAACQCADEGSVDRPVS